LLDQRERYSLSLSAEVFPLSFGRGIPSTKGRGTFGEPFDWHLKRGIKEYIFPFWIGLMDGDGSIQVNHWQLKILQYRVVIKLKNYSENEHMLRLIKKHFGGSVTQDKDFVKWAENTRSKVYNLLQLMQQANAPLSTRLCCQLDFALVCMKKNDVTWYLENRDSKYNLKKHYLDICKDRITKHISTNKAFYQAWLSGFVEAEASFSITNIKRRIKNKSVISSKDANNIANSQLLETTKIKYEILYRFSVAQKDDLYLLQSILDYFDCSTKQIYFRKDQCYEIQISRAKILNLIYNHFCQWPLLGYKKIQYNKFFEKWFSR
jgi:hypothetical protein